MKILDTNLWVFGTLEVNETARKLLAEIDRGETISAISAYMVQEALNAFERTPGLNPGECDELQTLFLTRLSRMTGLIEAPSSRDFSASLLDERRSSVRTNLLGRVTGVQPKDVPILVLAFKYREREPTIYTNDERFGQFEPNRFNCEELRIEYVE
ncbi:PIN domain-containing protein [Halovivax gelatinilyticus]|uniref:PIN domain-containing protein n=1 Tax=Halovivax gelatinilyticus TaxID=2961597 RepID=UPI0020CA43D2|nr:PIN domain-containing protein [Halovivax gelatinilyticus]